MALVIRDCPGSPFFKRGKVAITIRRMAAAEHGFVACWRLNVADGWMRTQHAKDYINALCKLQKCNMDDLVDVRYGG
jgi:hypothetical protein